MKPGESMKPFAEIQVDVTDIANQIMDYISADDSISCIQVDRGSF